MANYKIGEVSRLLKIPETTLRYYDKMGIIDSRKNQKNGYRFFNEVDLHNLMHYKLYRSYGLNQKQAQQCLYDFDLSEIERVLNEDQEELHRQLRFLEEKQKKLSQKIQFIQNMEKQLGTIHETQREASFLIGYRHRTVDNDIPLLDDQESCEILADWLDRLPLVSMTPYLFCADVRQRSIEEYSGLIVSQSLADELKLRLSEKVMSLPASCCISYVFQRQRAMNIPLIHFLDPVLHYLQDHHYKMDGIITFDPYIALKKHSDHLFYGRVLIPVRRISDTKKEVV